MIINTSPRKPNLWQDSHGTFLGIRYSLVFESWRPCADLPYCHDVATSNMANTTIWTKRKITRRHMQRNTTLSLIVMPVTRLQTVHGPFGTRRRRIQTAVASPSELNVFKFHTLSISSSCDDDIVGKVRKGRVEFASCLRARYATHQFDVASAAPSILFLVCYLLFSFFPLSCGWGTACSTRRTSGFVGFPFTLEPPE